MKKTIGIIGILMTLGALGYLIYDYGYCEGWTTGWTEGGRDRYPR